MKKTKLPGIIALQIALFCYFYFMGMIITNNPDIGHWSDNARLFFACVVVVINLISCIIYATNYKPNERE